MMKRSMVVDLQKLSRKYPSEVAALLEAMKRSRHMNVVCRAVRKARGIDEADWRSPPTFDGQPGLPAWRVARRLGWSRAMIRVNASLCGMRCLPNADGRLYFSPADVDRQAKIEKDKRRDGAPRLVPSAVSLREAAKLTALPLRSLRRTIRERSIFTWLRDGEVRIPMCELERLQGPLHPPDL